MWETIGEFFTFLWGRVTSGQIIIDVIDIAVVAFLVYEILRLAVQTRAEQLLKGVALVLVLYAIAHWLRMVALTFIMDAVIEIGILLIVVLFQPEIRRALEQIGRSNVVGGGLRLLNKSATVEAENAKIQDTINTVCRATTELSLTKTGALMVFERETKLGEMISTGTIVDAAVTTELIGTIFFPKTPLHDGAAIICNNRVRAAGCFLPLSQNFEISRELGTRHRAALGVSEISDAVVVVVSEESGKISLVENGQMLRGLTIEELRRRLADLLKTKVTPPGEKKHGHARSGGEEGEQSEQ